MMVILYIDDLKMVNFDGNIVKMILNDSRPVSLNWGSGCCALLADAARMGGLRTGGASHPPGFT